MRSEIISMANSNNQNAAGRGGDHASHEQHVRAGEQSHKNTTGKSGADQSGGNQSTGSIGGTRGGSSEQHAKAGEQSHKNR
jgi:hypothetical protein